MKLIKRLEEVALYGNIAVDAQMRKEQLQPDVYEYTFDFTWDMEQAKDPQAKLMLEWFLPCLDTHYMWQPCTNTKRLFEGNWRLHHTSMMTRSAPVACMHNGNDINSYTFATDEVKRVSSVHMGGSDYESDVTVRITLGLHQYTGKNSHTVKVLADYRPVPMHQALDNVRAWWEQVLPGVPLPVPEEAKLPMYSSWYAYHQKIEAAELEKQCRLAREMGMHTIIVDDGWQTGNSAGGYGYTGDWEVFPGKIPDMAEHVKKVHEAGLKYMLWYSVPFVGYYSKMWERFQDKVLYRDDRLHCATLDPRYPEVRRFLIDTYANAVKNWDLDGFKLDFIDSFVMPENDAIKPGMDFTCVQEATERLMLDIAAALKELKDDILIEFRQSYIGPMMRQFGNMFRVGDCAGDIVSNRIGTIDLRILSGNTAVHSDMLCWNHNETPEDAALQILHSIFGVIQFSQIISDMPESHRKMSAFWLDFAQKNKKVLLESELVPYEPHYLYPVVKAQDENEAIVAVYQRDKIVSLPQRKKVTIINASKSETIVVKTDALVQAETVARNTLGEITCRQTITLSGLTPLTVPNSGLIELNIL